MYLSELKLWNFRKYGNGEALYIEDKKLRQTDLTVPFVKGINVLIGENDSGKTAIIDAIKLVLKTHSYEWIKPQADDFYEDSKEFRIECHFEDLEINEAKNFTEWLTIFDDEKKPLEKPKLKVILDIKRNEDGRIFNYDVKAGPDDLGKTLDSEARDYLQTTYLKPLRDAKTDFESKRNSRFSQILQGHEAFKGVKNHYLVKLFKEFNEELKLYFDGKKNKTIDRDTGTNETVELNGKDEKAKDVKKTINKHLYAISDMSSELEVAPSDIKSILESLSLSVEEKNSGLGTYNKLYIAAELLHLEKENWDGIRLGLIEEMEAHLHPQAQMRVIEHFQSQGNIQFILTTHSPNLASKVDLKSLIICEKDTNNVFPLREGNTKLEPTDYTFLKRFLDTTKANLFFAKGVIMVEGWAEELLIPTLAEKIGYNLTGKGVSVVNVGGTSFLRYSKVFQRKINETPRMGIPISIITDVDQLPVEANPMKPDPNDGRKKGIEPYSLAEIIVLIKGKKESLEKKFNGQTVQTFVSPYWTLEYCLAHSNTFSKIFFESVKKATKEMKEDGKSIAEMTDDFAEIFKIDSQEQRAYRIYQEFVLDKEISKSIIAQYFAEELNNSSITKEEILSDKSIEYLIKAIKYACGDK